MMAMRINGRIKTRIKARKPVVMSAVLVAAGALGGAAPMTALPTPPANGEMGFILTAFAPGIHEGTDECTDGPAKTVRENYLQSLTPAERTRLSLPANEAELTTKWKAYGVGPNNTNLCANPELFDHPIQSTIKSTIAPGLDLDGNVDGKAVAGGCAHTNFTSPDGAPGVDNQAYRAMGCTRSWRNLSGTVGEISPGFNAMLKTGEHSTVLLLRGVHSLVHQDNVEIILANTDDRPVLDSKRNFITGASFTIAENPRYRNVLHGRIVDGVLTTKPADVLLNSRVGHGGTRGAHAEWDLRQGRFQLVFQPDGSLQGVFGGYQPVRNVIRSTILGGVGAVTVAGIDCASELATLQKLADGLRDPKTGQCTAVSAALDVAAVSAFVVDRPPATHLAAKDKD
jgi:hypothetical protein